MDGYSWDEPRRGDQDSGCYQRRQAVYHGHNGMIKLVDYMHEQHGGYQIEVDDMTRWGLW